MNEAEKRAVTGASLNVSDWTTTVTLDTPLEFYHKAGEDTYGSDNVSIEIMPEFIILDRNIVIRGDPETSEDSMHGA